MSDTELVISPQAIGSAQIVDRLPERDRTAARALDQAQSALITALAAVDSAREQLRRAASSNLKAAPFYLNEASTAAILTGRTGPGVAAVPIAPTRLVDRPRASEDPRLAKANDDAAASTHSRQRIDIDPVLWGAFLDAYLRPEMPSVESARSICAQIAAARGLRMPSGATLRRRLREENVIRAPAPRRLSRRLADIEAEAFASAEPAPAPTLHSPDNGGCFADKKIVETDKRPTVVAEPEPPVAMRPVQSAPIVRSAPVWPDAPLPADIGDDEDEDDGVVADFAAALQRVRERKAGAVETDESKVYWGRVAAALRAAPVKAPAPVRRPTRPALSREECPRCGIPGWKGCDHQLPYEDAAR